MDPGFSVAETEEYPDIALSAESQEDVGTKPPDLTIIPHDTGKDIHAEQILIPEPEFKDESPIIPESARKKPLLLSTLPKLRRLLISFRHLKMKLFLKASRLFRPPLPKVNPHQPFQITCENLRLN
jgi:hypothetical protein